MVGSPAGHYLVNLLLHVTTSVLLFLFLDRTTGRRWPAFVAVALWAVHPLRVESVAWLAERKDVLSGCFAAAILLAYGRFARRPSLGAYATVSLLLAIGLLAKPMLVTVPLLLLLVDVWPLHRVELPPWPRLDRRRVGRLLLEKVPWLGLSLAASLVALHFQGREGEWKSVSVGLPLVWRLENAVLAVAAYVERTVAPIGLAAFYPLSPTPPSLAVVAPTFVGGLVVTLLVVAAHLEPWLREHPDDAALRRQLAELRAQTLADGSSEQSDGGASERFRRTR